MESFGYANIGSQLIRKSDGAIFSVLTLMGYHLYVQRTFSVRDLASWLRPNKRGGGFTGVRFSDLELRDRVISTDHPLCEFTVLAKDSGTNEIIVGEGFITTDPTLWLWNLARPQ